MKKKMMLVAAMVVVVLVAGGEALAQTGEVLRAAAHDAASHSPRAVADAPGAPCCEVAGRQSRADSAQERSDVSSCQDSSDGAGTPGSTDWSGFPGFEMVSFVTRAIQVAERGVPHTAVPVPVAVPY